MSHFDVYSQYGLNELKLRFRARLSLHLYKQYMEYVKGVHVLLYLATLYLYLETVYTFHASLGYANTSCVYLCIFILIYAL